MRGVEMSSVNVTVLVNDEFGDRFADVVGGLEKVGMKVDQQLRTIRVISGSVDSAKVGALKQVNGVASVEVSRSIQIAPPDSDLQ
jgi:hypothetical protein